MSDDYSDVLAPFYEDYNTLLAFSVVMLAAIIMTLPLLIFCEKGTRGRRQVIPTDEVVEYDEEVEKADRDQQTERKRPEWLDLLNPNPTDEESQVEYPEMEDKGTNSSKVVVVDRVIYKRPTGRESYLSLETILPSETEIFTQTSQSYNAADSEVKPSPTYPILQEKRTSEPSGEGGGNSSKPSKKTESEPQNRADKIPETSGKNGKHSNKPSKKPKWDPLNHADNMRDTPGGNEKHSKKHCKRTESDPQNHADNMTDTPGEYERHSKKHSKRTSSDLDPQIHSDNMRETSKKCEKKTPMRPKTRRPLQCNKMEEDRYLPPSQRANQKPYYPFGSAPERHANLAPVEPFKPRSPVPPLDAYYPPRLTPDYTRATQQQRNDLNSQGFDTHWTNYCGASGGFEAPQEVARPAVQGYPRNACQSCTARYAANNAPVSPVRCPTKGKSWWRFFW